MLPLSCLPHIVSLSVLALVHSRFVDGQQFMIQFLSKFLAVAVAAAPVLVLALILVAVLVFGEKNRKESKEKVIGAINSLKCFVRVIKIAFGARLTDLARNADDDDDDDDDENDNDE